VLNSLTKVVNALRGERSVIISATGFEVNGNTRTHIDPLFVSSSDELAIAPPPYKIEKPESALRRIYRNIFQRDRDFSRSMRTEPILFAELDIAEGQAAKQKAAAPLHAKAQAATAQDQNHAAPLSAESKADLLELPEQNECAQEAPTEQAANAKDADLSLEPQDSILYSDVGDTARKGEKSFYAAGSAAQEALSNQDEQALADAAPCPASKPADLTPPADILLEKTAFDVDEPALGTVLSDACDTEATSQAAPDFTLSYDLQQSVAAEAEISVGQLAKMDVALEQEEPFAVVEPPILEEIYAAAAKKEPALHPFLMKNEPNLPKPSEPFPTLDLLEPATSQYEPEGEELLQQKARTIEERLAEYKIKV
ncbi:MAG: hypothetical protein ACRC9T_00980, partial [Vibrionaceae bacterium]